MTHTILIVDDDISQLNLLELILKRDGYIVLTAESGAQALEILTNHIPDTILLDFMMPDMNGVELCQHIRKFEQTRSTPILFLSARSDEHSKEEGLSAGADGYLTKPILPADLLRHIHAILLRVPES
jgi:two-component system alkaline phosphatase synthesis response regulator PhoP